MTSLDVGIGSARIGSFDKPKQIKGSIIKKKYKDVYKKLGGLCGDDVSTELTSFTLGGDKNKPKIDLALLRKVAEDNGIWHDKYIKLNAGQQRMTIGNRLRNKIIAGYSVKIGNRVMGGEYEE